jgi:predicted glutamine amidotransferase
MCIIAYTEKRSLTKKEFNECWKSNPDGFGMAYSKDGKLYVHKGIMKLDEAWSKYIEVKKHRVVMHFRIKTAGAICPELTHPFIISDTSPTLTNFATGNNQIVFHNGCIWGWEKDCFEFLLAKEKGGKVTGHMSDSRFVALQMNNVKRKDRFDFLNKLSGKFVLMDHKTITLVGAFEENDGVFYSNSTYKESTYWKGWEDWDNWNYKNEIKKISKEKKESFNLHDYVELLYGTKLFEKGSILKIKSIMYSKGKEFLTVTDGYVTQQVYNSLVRKVDYGVEYTSNPYNKEDEDDERFSCNCG